MPPSISSYNHREGISEKILLETEKIEQNDEKYDENYAIVFDHENEFARTLDNYTANNSMTAKVTNQHTDLDFLEYLVLVLLLWCSKIGIVKISEILRNILYCRTTKRVLYNVKKCAKGCWKAMVSILGFSMPSFSVITVALMLYLLYHGGQSKDGRISPEIPGASNVPNSPPSLQIPINLAPSQASGQDEDKTSSATPNLESSKSSSVSSEEVSPLPGSGSEGEGRPVSPPGGGSPNQPEEPAPSMVVKKEDPSVEAKDEQVKPDESGRPRVHVQEPAQIPEAKVSEATPEKPDEVPKIPDLVTEKAEETAKTSEKDAKADGVVAKPVDEVTKAEEQPPAESETIQKKDATEVDALKAAEIAEAVTESTEPVAKTDEDKAKSAETEEPIVADPHEDIPSFGEWKKKALEEEEQKQTNGKLVHLSEPSALTKRPSTMRTNYASLSCGAKVLGHNAEVQHAEYVLSDNKDQYMINPCKVEKKWFVVELCEPIQVKFIDIANFELFSSLPENFKVFTSDRYPSKDWKYLGIFYAKGERKIQSFPIYGQELYSKYVRIEMISHYGTEHFCPISLLRIFGKSYADIDDDDGHEGSHDDIDSDGKAKEEHGSGNLFTSATDLVLNVVKKVLNVNEDQDAGNVTAEAIDPSNNTEPTTEPGCHVDKNGEKDPASAQSDSAHRSSPAPSPTSTTPPSVLLTSLVRNRCQACTISQSNYRTYRPIIGPGRCVYMYTMLTSAHAHGHARECSCKRCRKDRLVENRKQTPVITPPIVGSTKQAVAIETVHPSVETDIGVPMATLTTDNKIKPTAASVEATKENLAPTQQPVVVASEASQPEVVKEDVVKQTHVAMETTKTVAVGNTKTPTEELKETDQIKTKIHHIPVDSVGVSVGGTNNIDSNIGAGAKNGENSNAEDVQNADTKVGDNSKQVQSKDTAKAAETNTANSNNGNGEQNSVNTNTVNQNGGEKSDDNNINLQQAQDNQNTNAVNQQANQQLDSVTSEDIPAFENPDLKIPDPTKMADTDSWLDFPDQTELPVGGPASAGKRESAIMRINNRLKKLELNMSLSSRYLEELSQTYRKQMESMYRSFNKTIARLTNTSRLAAISEQRQQENIQALRKQLGELGNTVAAMQNTIDNMHIRYLETHLFWIVVELFIMIAIVVTCTRRGASRQQVQAMIDGIGLPDIPRTRALSTRRLSDSYLHGSPHKSLLKRTGSDSNLNIIEPNLPFLLDEKAPSEVPKEKKRRKPKKSRRSLGSDPPNSAEPTAHVQTNGYHGYNGHVTRSLSLENVAAMMSDDVYPTTSTTSSSGHHNGVTSSCDRRHYDKPVEFIGPLDFYERRFDKGKKKKKRDNLIENGHQKFHEDGGRRKNRTSPLVGQPSNWAKPFSQSQPFYLVQNGNFGFLPSPRHSPRGSPKSSRRNSPEIMMAKSYEHRPFYRMNDTNSEIVRFPQQKFSPESFSDSGRPPTHAQYGKRGKFPAKKSKAKSSSMDQMER